MTRGAKKIKQKKNYAESAFFIYFIQMREASLDYKSSRVLGREMQKISDPSRNNGHKTRGVKKISFRGSHNFPHLYLISQSAKVT